jgi:phosphotransferase system enzyme I (PtsI)
LGEYAGLTVDGDSGEVLVHQEEVTIVAATAGTAAAWNGVGQTSDGHRVKVLGNIGSAADAKNVAKAGAEGVGLFRTEFSYLSASSEPSVADQTKQYIEVFAPLAGKTITVRTLDAGADKPLSFLDQGEEPNPALGVRGVRVAFDNEGVLNRQLAAIAAAAKETGADVQVMAPMIATAPEAKWFADRVHAAGIARAGVMIEVPAAALSAKDIFAEVDFVSLGTNDLAQYLFAADRQLGAVAALNDPWQPALLRLIGIVGQAAAEAGKPAGICGESASDPLLAPVLVGLGVTSLSMNSGSVNRVGAALQDLSLAQCQAAAAAAIGTSTPTAAKAAVRAAIA